MGESTDANDPTPQAIKSDLNSPSKQHPTNTFAMIN